MIERCDVSRVFALLHYFCFAVEKVPEKTLCSHTIFPLCTLFLWCKKMGEKNVIAQWVVVQIFD